MSGEHAHKDMNYSIVYEPKVHSDAHVREIALKSLKNVPGGTALVEEHFSKGGVEYTLYNTCEKSSQSAHAPRFLDVCNSVCCDSV